MIKIGNAVVSRVEEQCGLGFFPEMLFPDWSGEALEKHRDWMVPTYFDELENRFIASIHTWVIKTRHHTILVDTCAGNDKERPLIERFHRRNLPYLENLMAAGVRPEDVDYVLCTHLHADHCGWNTRLMDGRWVPTFPNAKYVFSRAEYEHWSGPAGKEGFNVNVYEDSVLPIIEAGQAEIVESDHALGDNLVFHPTPGHCAGHMAIRLIDAGDEAVFSGDTMHQPIQIYEPHWNSAFCEDAELARASRRWVLEHCSSTDALLLPAHFAGTFAGHVRRKGDAFSWCPLPSR